jgi:BlaI family transcriptional regulator, penicillinase repressor
LNLIEENRMSERISEAEHAVMEVLWADAPLEATRVAERLEGAQDWSLPTVKTLLSRLVAKGALATESAGRKFLYRPLVARADYVSGESQRLVERLFGGKLSPLVAHFAEHETLSEEDIAELRALVERIGR